MRGHRAALEAFDEALGRRGELQARPVDIHSQLRALLALLPEPEIDTAKAHQLLRDLAGVFRGLADNAQAFMGSLRRTIDLHDADLDVSLANKEQLIDYFPRFIRDLVVTSARIVEVLRKIKPPGAVRGRLPGPGLGVAAGRGDLPGVSRTMHRDPRRGRRDRGTPPPGHPFRHVKPELVAGQPNTVWSWDITKLRAVPASTDPFASRSWEPSPEPSFRYTAGHRSSRRFRRPPTRRATPQRNP
ncbi:DUF2397 family protein [Frankia sp. CiP3]|uniref:DUF2397 family protein n=1 Tax=Frankia sp. CiP3 TaxID=2880971 RepID=UPI0035AC162C